MQLFTVYGAGELVMIAPLKTISQYFTLHKSAERRIIAETSAGEVCKIFISRGIFHGKEYEVKALV